MREHINRMKVLNIMLTSLINTSSSEMLKAYKTLTVKKLHFKIIFLN